MIPWETPKASPGRIHARTAPGTPWPNWSSRPTPLSTTKVSLPGPPPCTAAAAARAPSSPLKLLPRSLRLAYAPTPARTRKRSVRASVIYIPEKKSTGALFGLAQCEPGAIAWGARFIDSKGRFACVPTLGCMHNCALKLSWVHTW